MDEILPRPNNLPPISIRKSAFGRTNLFLDSNNALFKEVKCSGSAMARQASASVYHVHETNNLEKQPKSIVCWHCCHSFEGNGFRLPRSYDPAEKIYHVYGWFCSANCCKAYILEHSTFDRGYQMNVFVRMLRDIYKIEGTVIESPPRIALKMFGGPFDIDSFRKQTNVCMTVQPPFVSYCMLIEERQPIQSIGETDKVRGTVKGMRRPISGSVTVTEDDLGSPESIGLYSDFLETKETEKEETVIETGPQIKKQRTTKEKKNTEKKQVQGLERFMSHK